MPLTLESFTLLNAKVSRFEFGVPGEPDITYHDVCDLLARLSPGAAAYTRVKFALQDNWMGRLEYQVKSIVIQAIKMRVFPLYYGSIIHLAIGMHINDKHLTPLVKSRAIGRRWWTRKNEEDLRFALGILDDYHYELIHTLRDWNHEVNAYQIEN